MLAKALPTEAGNRDTTSIDVLKMSFSIGVSMYRENVTSYWYFFRRTHRTSEVITEGDEVEGVGRAMARYPGYSCDSCRRGILAAVS